MSKCEFNRRHLTCQELSFGPLRWRSTSLSEAEELDGNTEHTPQTFAERLHVLIRQAVREGCTSQELHTILSQHTLGDNHGDA